MNKSHTGVYDRIESGCRDFTHKRSLLFVYLHGLSVFTFPILQVLTCSCRFRAQHFPHVLRLSSIYVRYLFSPFILVCQRNTHHLLQRGRALESRIVDFPEHFFLRSTIMTLLVGMSSIYSSFKLCILGCQEVSKK
jgi:hypothetical protein